MYPDEVVKFSSSFLSPVWISVSSSVSGLSLHREAEGDEVEAVDSSLSESVISPSSGSLLPSESSLKDGLFFFFLFVDFDFFFFFFFDLSSLSCEPSLCFFFLLDEDLPLSSRRGYLSLLRDLRFVLRESDVWLAGCSSARLLCSCFNVNSFISWHQRIKRGVVNASPEEDWERDSQLCSVVFESLSTVGDLRLQIPIVL